MCLFFGFSVFLRAALDGDNCKSKDHFFTPVSGLFQLCLTKEDVVSETALKYNSAFLNRSSSFSDECVGTSLWQCPKIVRALRMNAQRSSKSSASHLCLCSLSKAWINFPNLFLTSAYFTLIFILLPSAWMVFFMPEADKVFLWY